MTEQGDDCLRELLRDRAEETPGHSAPETGGRKALLTVHVVVSVGWLGMTLCLLTLGSWGLFRYRWALTKFWLTRSPQSSRGRDSGPCVLEHARARDRRSMSGLGYSSHAGRGV